MSKYRWFLIVKENCPSCIYAKQFLDSKGEKDVKYAEINTIRPDVLEKIRIHFANNWSTVPMVYYKGRFIGGCDELVKNYNNVIQY
jgi:glutaredoxin-related protein